MSADDPKFPTPSDRTYASVSLSTAANGQSDAITLTGRRPAAIQLSTAWTAAHLGFQGSVDGGTTFAPLYNSDGTRLQHTVAASRLIGFDSAPFAGLTHLKLVSESTAGAAVAQGAARTLKVGLTAGSG